jgi:tetratricopeptide (TPR) repeat protein
VGEGASRREIGLLTVRRWVPVALLLAACLVVGLFPADREAIAAMERGDGLAERRRYSDALREYALAAERCPGCSPPLLRQAAIYVAQQRYAEGAAAYLEAVRRGGLSDEAMEGQARRHLAEGHPAWAIGYLEELVARRPGRGDLWLALGDAAVALGEPERAAEAWTRALGAEVALGDAQRQAVHDRLARCCLERGGEEACALEEWREVERGPDQELAAAAGRLVAVLGGLERAAGGTADERALAQARLGEALLRYGDLALARRAFETAVELSPEYVDGHAYLGHVLSLSGESAAAVQHLERAIALEPAYPLPHYFLGMHYARRGWWLTARDILVQAHDLDPENPAICVAVGETYLRAERADYAVAERWLRVAVDLAPDDVRFHLVLAHFYVDALVDPAVRGIAVAQVAVQMAPENPEAQETLGWAYYLAGQPDLALDPLRRAWELAPEEARILYRLGEVYRALGQPALAQRFYQAAVDRDWNGPIGERARRAMPE